MSFEEILTNDFEQMMSYRKAMGFGPESYGRTLAPFLRYCALQYPDGTCITQDMVDSWLLSHPYSANGQAVFISRLRQYSKYQVFLGHGSFIPDEDYSVRKTVYEPYLFTDQELAGLFCAIDTYTGKTSGKKYLPEMILPVYSRMLYCCGMRPQEPPSLLWKDINLSTGDVYIRQSKQHKDRHITLSENMLRLCNAYDRLSGTRTWFFQKPDGNPYNAAWYDGVFRIILKCSSVIWRGHPRPYDLRHAFATRTIIRWMEDGRDIMGLMPFLSAYMGHSDFSSTLYYVHLLPEKLRSSAKINWKMLSAIYHKEVDAGED